METSEKEMRCLESGKMVGNDSPRTDVVVGRCALMQQQQNIKTNQTRERTDDHECDLMRGVTFA